MRFISFCVVVVVDPSQRSFLYLIVSHGCEIAKRYFWMALVEASAIKRTPRGGAEPSAGFGVFIGMEKEPPDSTADKNRQHRKALLGALARAILCMSGPASIRALFCGMMWAPRLGSLRYANQTEPVLMSPRLGEPCPPGLGIVPDILGKDGAVAKCLTRASCHFPRSALHDGNMGSSPWGGVRSGGPARRRSDLQAQSASIGGEATPRRSEISHAIGKSVHGNNRAIWNKSAGRDANVFRACY